MPFLADFRRTVRSLVRARGFAIAVILTLALGIGANTAMFTLLRGTLLRPLPNREGERLVYLRQSAKAAGQDNVAFSVPEIVDYTNGSKTLSGIAQYSQLTFTMFDAELPVHIQVGIISGNFFDVMGLGMLMGRPTNSGDDGPNAPAVAVLSHNFWMQHFGGDKSVIGKVVRINDRPSTIIGIAQRAPQYPARTDVFVNTVTSPHHMSATMVTGRTHRMTEIFARQKPGFTLEQTRSEIARLSSTVYADHPDSYEKASGYSITVMSLREALNERASLTMWLLMGAAAFVLLISCANVANLTLMRGVRREREMLVRAALGAGTWRLRMLLLVENLALALVGGALGVLVAFAGLEMLKGFAQQLSPRAEDVQVDGTVLLVTLGVSLAAAIALSFVPRFGDEKSLAGPLAAGGRRTTAGKSSHRLQHTLVIAQLAVCVVLLTAAGLLVRTLGKLQSVETGVRAENVLTLEVPIESDAIKSEERLAMYERMRDRIAALPGVEVASTGSNVPLRYTQLALELKAEGRALAANEATPRATFKAADPNYFAAAGVPLLSGRAFTSTDRPNSARVVILNKSLAERLFPGQDPVGRRVAWTGEVLKFIDLSDEWRTVVGVVGDTRDSGLDSDPTPTVFQPLGQWQIFSGALIIRTKQDPVALEPAVLRVIRELYPRQLIENVATLEEVRDATVAPRKLNALFIASFGALAMIIAVVGIAGVLAFSVSARTAEIGIRMSLGATTGQVRRMILSEGGTLVVIGLVLGAIGALAASRLMQGLLFGVEPSDPATLMFVALIMAAASIAACLVPAIRASRVDPSVALRSE
ncbi:MAG TPA: ABC transporter permease [Gemmatimonadaceae bacterium]|nr:ABC transporter permease [Gemmatimonadaceae bacterium]